MSQYSLSSYEGGNEDSSDSGFEISFKSESTEFLEERSDIFDVDYDLQTTPKKSFQELNTPEKRKLYETFSTAFNISANSGFQKVDNSYGYVNNYQYTPQNSPQKIIEPCLYQTPDKEIKFEGNIFTSTPEKCREERPKKR